MMIDGVKITSHGFRPSKAELKKYIEYAREKGGKDVTEVRLKLCDDGMVDVTFKKNIPFERIRRITGYLTGTLDTWNDAKKSEEHDRVKHDVYLGGNEQ